MFIYLQPFLWRALRSASQTCFAWLLSTVSAGKHLGSALDAVAHVQLPLMFAQTDGDSADTTKNKQLELMELWQLHKRRHKHIMSPHLTSPSIALILLYIALMLLYDKSGVNCGCFAG